MKNPSIRMRTKTISKLLRSHPYRSRDTSSTKDKDSHTNSDEANRETKLEEIKKSMQERKIKKFDSALA